LGKEGPDVALQVDRQRAVVVALGNLAGLGDEELLEVPGEVVGRDGVPVNPFSRQEVGRGLRATLFQPDKDGVGVLAVDVADLHQRELGNISVSGANILQDVHDLAILSGFFVAKLRTGEANDSEILDAKHIDQLIGLSKSVNSFTSESCRVHDKNNGPS